ncbi:MAG: enoyl-CoA hydratase-related protein [bacterium]
MCALDYLSAVPGAPKPGGTGVRCAGGIWKRRVSREKPEREARMKYSTLITETEGNVLIVTLNRPPMNALNGELIVELGRLLDEAGEDAEVRAVVITGSGDKAFSAGADLSSGFGEDVGSFVKRGQDAFTRIERFGRPVVAAINGHALGGGCEMAMACHFRIMKEGGTIGLTESSLGIIPGYGGTQRLPRLIGRSRALEMMILGKRIGAGEALELGLVNEVCGEGETLEKAKGLARRLAERAPVASKLIIDAVARGADLPIEDALAVERENFVKVIGTQDAAEGIRAFFEKKKPEFKGK